MIDEVFFAKAEESLVGAESELAGGRYNNCANRCYYACFQAAVAALIHAGIVPPASSGQWGHAFVQGQFVSQLVTRRKVYPASLRDVLARNLELRQVGDYRHESVTAAQAGRAIQRAREFVEVVRARGARAV